MVKRIVQLHKGGIEVSSTFGVGTRFAVTLPRLSGPEEEQAQQEEQQEPENKKNQEQTQQKEDKRPGIKSKGNSAKKRFRRSP